MCIAAKAAIEQVANVKSATITRKSQHHQREAREPNCAVLATARELGNILSESLQCVSIFVIRLPGKNGLVTTYTVR